MNQQTINYFQRLLSQKSSKSIAISLGCTQMKLHKITANIQKPVNPQINKSTSSRTIIQNRLFSESKFNRNKIQTETDEHQKCKFLDLVQKIKRVRTQTENNLNNTISNLTKMKLQTKLMSSIRKQQEIVKYLKKIDEEKIRKTEEKTKQQQQIRNRQRLILNRLEILQNQKQKRCAIMSEKLMQQEPKYKLIEKQYLVKQIQKQLQDKAFLKHQKEFKQKFKVPELSQNKNSAKGQKNTIKKHQLAQDDYSIEKLKKMAEVKNELQQKSRRIMNSMRKQKNLEIEIIKDKNLNPFKYNFLRAKNLTDQQIFNQFKDFQLHLNPKSLGNTYLQDLKNKHLKESRQQTEQDVKSDERQLSDVSSHHNLQNMTSTSNNSENIKNNPKQLQSLPHQQRTQRKIPKCSSDQKIKDRSFQRQKIQLMQKMVDEDYLSFLKAKINSFHQYPFL